MTTPTIEAVDTAAVTALAQDLRAETSTLIEAAPVKIVDDASYAKAAEFLKDLAARRKYVVAKFKEPKDAANRAHKGICALENELLAPIDKADQSQRAALQAYTREQERIRRDEEHRLAEEARKAEQARLLSEAAILESQGHKAVAESIVEQAIEVAAPVVTLAPSTPKVAGVSTGEAWTWKAVNGDEARAVEFLAKTGNHAFLTLDTRKLAAFARMHKSGAALPGIQFFDQGKVIVRG